MLSRAAASALAASGRRAASPATPAFARWLATKDDANSADAAPSTSSSADASPSKPAGKGPRGRKPSRRVAGSWAVSQELEDDLEAAREVPAGAHLYDLQNTFPYFYQPRGVEDVAAALKAALADAKKGGKKGAVEDGDAPPRPGARQVVCWETRAVLHAGPAGADHPANRKVVASVKLADLAAEAGLSDDAARHVALVAGPRYNPHSGVLRLTSESAPAREGNVAIVERVLRELVAEGKRVHPA